MKAWSLDVHVHHRNTLTTARKVKCGMDKRSCAANSSLVRVKDHSA
jgi:hypothetical protein